MKLPTLDVVVVPWGVFLLAAKKVDHTEGRLVRLSDLDLGLHQICIDC